METVKFARLSESTQEEAQLVCRNEIEEAKKLPERLLAELKKLENDYLGLQVSRLEHSLQSATRAYHDGRDEEYVVAALLHDLGDKLAPYSHGEFAAAIFKPFMSERLCWVVAHHPIFQKFYYAHHLGGDRDEREKYRDSPYYQDTVEFCAKYDESCFDPNYQSLPLEFFEPMVHRIFSQPR